jgi:hypothetical protein
VELAAGPLTLLTKEDEIDFFSFIDSCELEVDRTPESPFVFAFIILTNYNHLLNSAFLINNLPPKLDN